MSAMATQIILNAMRTCLLCGETLKGPAAGHAGVAHTRERLRVQPPPVVHDVLPRWLLRHLQQHDLQVDSLAKL